MPQLCCAFLPFGQESLHRGVRQKSGGAEKHRLQIFLLLKIVELFQRKFRGELTEGVFVVFISK